MAVKFLFYVWERIFFIMPIRFGPDEKRLGAKHGILFLAKKILSAILNFFQQIENERN
jgi:hypothetical protein